MIPIRCVCGERYEVNDSMAGHEATCDACDRRITVPSATPQAAHFGLSTAKFMTQSPLDNLTPEQARRLAKRRSRSQPRVRGYAPSTIAAAGSGGILGLVLFFVMFGLLGFIVWGIFLVIAAMFAAFFNYLDRRALDAEYAEIERSLVESMDDEER